MDTPWSRFESGDLEGLKTFLAESPTDAPMRIILKGEHWGLAACEAIEKSGVGDRLRFLSMADTRIGDVGLAALAWSDAVRSVVTLCLERSRITDWGVKQLATTSCFQNLQTLYICNTNGVETGQRDEIGDEGAIAIAESPHLASLKEINFSYTHVGDAGFEALFSSPNLPKLSSVTAWGTNLTREGWEKVKALSAPKNYTPWIHTDFDERSPEY